MRTGLIGLVLALVPATVGAQTLADLTGTWRQERDAVRAEGPETRITARELVVSRSGGRVTVTRRVGATALTATYDLLAASTTNAGLLGQVRTSRAGWADAALVIEETEVVSQPTGTATVTVTERWRVLADGRLEVQVTSAAGPSTVTRTYTYAKVQP